MVFKITKRLSNFTFWIGIFGAAILFAAGHLPVVYKAVSHPTLSLVTYILFGNTVAGICFGWLYWKKGLEAAFIGHVFAHVAMMMGEELFNL